MCHLPQILKKKTGGFKRANIIHSRTCIGITLQIVKTINYIKAKK